MGPFQEILKIVTNLFIFDRSCQKTITLLVSYKRSFIQLLNKKKIKATCVAILNLLTKMLSGSRVGPVGVAPVGVAPIGLYTKMGKSRKI